jgi:hypothetical protein
MLRTSLIVIVITLTSAFAQSQNISTFRFSSDNHSAPLKQNSKAYYDIDKHFSDSNKTDTKVKTEVRSKKSPGLAMIYSLFVPGMGQLYTKRFDVGKYFLISEAVLWLGYGSFTVYGNWLLNDAYDYSVIHAGVTKGNKSKTDDFWVNISNYDNVEQYNNDMLERGNYDKVYYPGTGYDFYWDNVTDREAYREDKLAADRIHNDRLFIVGAILVNHIVSAISAIVLTNNYNAGVKSAGGLVINADVMRHFNHVDGIRLNLTKWF